MRSTASQSQYGVSLFGQCDPSVFGADAGYAAKSLGADPCDKLCEYQTPYSNISTLSSTLKERAEEV